MRARSSASLRELVPVVEPADRKDGFLSRWNKSRALIAASGVRGSAALDPETAAEEAAAEKARLHGKRQALALAAGVSATVWLSLAVSAFFAIRGHGISTP